jgi:hypothetical protein
VTDRRGAGNLFGHFSPKLMRHRTFFLALTLLCASACGGSSDAVREARVDLAAGDLTGAEAAVGVEQSFDADEVRHQIARARETQRKLELQIKEIVRQSGAAPDDARAKLESLRDAQPDALGRQTVEKTLGEFDVLATEQMNLARARAELEQPQQEVDLAAGAKTDNLSAANLTAKIHASIALKNWALALTDLATLEKAKPGAADVARLRKQVEEGAFAYSQAVITRANQLEYDNGLVPALVYITRESANFPNSSEFATVHELRDDMARRKQEHDVIAAGGTPAPAGQAAVAASSPATEARAAPRAPQPKAITPDLTVDELAQMARENEEQGGLEFALQCWTAAGHVVEPGNLRDDYVGQAQDLRARLALRSEITDAFKSAPSLLEGLGITAVDAQGWIDGGRRYEWSAIAPDQLKRVATKLDVSKLARRGVVCETLHTANDIEREHAFGDLARMVERGEIAPADAANLVSRARGGIGASERYLLEKGQWVSSSAQSAEARRVQLAQLEKAFLHANAEQREAAFKEVVASGDDAFVTHVLGMRAQDALHQIEKVRVLDQLADLAKVRRELDDARKTALAAIFDEKVYFYPYNPPEPPNTEGDYARAQRHVDEVVDAVRAVWKSEKAVRISKEFRAALDDLTWCSAQCATLKIPFDTGGKVPEYALCLPADLDSITLHEFAWDKGDAHAVAYSRKVDAHNEAVWKAIDGKKITLEPAAVPDVSEREQVRITNAYRVMMGRCALAWNAKLQLAAQGHSEYMANTGDFGHFEKDPARHSPFDRMKLAGYVHGEGENCAMIGGDPKGAHDGWLHSSGHHRNILEANHREMASGLASNYWTQNFGADTPQLGEVEH